MRALLARIGLNLTYASLLVAAALEAPPPQIPVTQTVFGFSAPPHLWNFSQAPDANSTSHLVFDTVNSFLQHWPNTRYRNGHNLVPGKVPVGTLLYHGTYRDIVPPVPEWTATDPEHSMLFCAGMHRAGQECWHLTLATTRELNVLYFDGSAAAKMKSGPMDSQDFVAWDEVKPEWYFNEWKRIKDLCKWGRDLGIDGFVRMEVDFEIMLCDFTVGVRLVSALNLEASWADTPRSPPKPDIIPANDTLSTLVYNPTWSPKTPEHSMQYRVLEAGRWHNTHPGETRVVLDYSRIISFYNVSLFPSLVKARYGKERWDHRLIGVTDDEWARAKDILEAGYKAKVNQTSSIDWKTLFATVSARYMTRLELLQFILRPSSPDSIDDSEVEEILKRALGHVQSIIPHYLLRNAVPPSGTTRLDTAPFSWATKVWHQCTVAHTQHISDDPLIFGHLTASEKFLLQSITDVSKEICRVLVRIWAEGFEERVGKNSNVLQQPRHIARKDMLTRWRNDTERLVSWLDWSGWVKCKPECNYEETCYLPTWPYFRKKPGTPWNPPFDETKHWLRTLLMRGSLSGLGHVDSEYETSAIFAEDKDSDWWERPQPICIRRIEPFNV